MSMLGPTLEDLFNICNRKFTLKTVLMLALQMVYVSGFGLSKRYLDDTTFTHVPCNKAIPAYFTGQVATLNMATRQERSKRRGNAIYASLNSLFQCEQGRRNDLESLGFVMYFLRGSLPWEAVESQNNREKIEKIREMKVSLEVLCEGYPPEFTSRRCDLAFDWKHEQSQIAGLRNGSDAGEVSSSQGVFVEGAALEQLDI